MEHFLGWVFFSILLVGALEYYDSFSFHALSSISDLDSLSLPVRVGVEGVVSSIRVTRTSWTFDLTNGGQLTCYWRNPPSNESVVLPGERYWVRARVEATPRGRLCVVEEVAWRGVG